ncbi:MAG TPA: hypothetical protein VFT95_13225 [Micromonosporaceae bacterium]|nr:hypothetical protein [Micromonosporaceae bacterium]
MRDPSERAEKRAAPAGEVYRLVVQGCCAAGGLAGLWLGFLAALGRRGDPDAGAALAAVILPVGWRVAAGVIIGALVAWAASVAIPWLRAAPR